MKRDHYIVGSINKQSGAVSFSNIPKMHSNAKSAVAEAERLATENKDRKFMVVMILGIASSNNVIWE